MKSKCFLKFFLYGVFLLNTLALNANPIFFDPNEEELSLPFEIQNGRIEVHLPFLNLNDFEKVRLIAQCNVKIRSKGGNQEVEVSVYKNTQFKFAKVKFTENGKTTEQKNPFVLSKTITKDSLGQYSTAVEVAHLMGITQVDSLKVFLVDPDLRHVKNLIFFFDEDGDLIDKTIFINNQWKRCSSI